MTLADQYYLKAADNFPFCLEFVVENLNYALSYDEEHTQALCLLGRLYMFEMKDYGLAAHSFKRALQSNMSYPDTYKYFGLLKIWVSDFDGAERLLNQGLKVKGMDKAVLLLLKAKVCECKGELAKAKLLLDKANLLTMDGELIHNIESVLQRIKKKEKAMKRRKRKIKQKMKVLR